MSCTPGIEQAGTPQTTSSSRMRIPYVRSVQGKYLPHPVMSLDASPNKDVPSGTLPCVAGRSSGGCSLRACPPNSCTLASTRPCVSSYEVPLV